VTRTQPSTLSAPSIYISNWQDLVGVWQARALTASQAWQAPGMREVRYLAGENPNPAINQIVDWTGFFRDETNNQRFTDVSNFRTKAYFGSSATDAGILSTEYLAYDGGPQPPCTISRNFVAVPRQQFFVVRYQVTNTTGREITFNILDQLHPANHGLAAGKAAHAWYDPDRRALIADLTASGQPLMALGSLDQADGYQVGNDAESSGDQRSAWSAFDENGTLPGNTTIDALDLDLAFNRKLTVAAGKSAETFLYLAFGPDQASLEAQLDLVRAKTGRQWFAQAVREHKRWLSSGLRTKAPDDGLKDLFDRSLIVVKHAQNPVAGPFVATTNPVAYGYWGWMRDGSLTAIALDASGHHDEASRYWRWMAAQQKPDGTWHTRTGVWDDAPDDFVAPEYDSVGQFLYGTARHHLATQDNVFLQDIWPAAKQAADWIIDNIASANGLGASDCSIWEEEQEYNAFTQAWYVAGLYGAQILAEAQDNHQLVDWYAGGPASIISAVQRPSDATPPGLWNGNGFYNRAITVDGAPRVTVDSSTNILPVLGVIDPLSARAAAHVATVVRLLGRDIYGVARYPQDGYYFDKDYDPAGDEAEAAEPSWPQMSMWVAVHEALTGDTDSALARLRWLASTSGAGYMPQGEAVSNVTRLSVLSSMSEPLTAASFILAALACDGQSDPRLEPRLHQAGCWAQLSLTPEAADNLQQWETLPYFTTSQPDPMLRPTTSLARWQVANDDDSLYIRLDNRARTLPEFGADPKFAVRIYAADFASPETGISRGLSGEALLRVACFAAQRTSDSNVFERWTVQDGEWSAGNSVDTDVIPQWDPASGIIEVKVPLSAVSSRTPRIGENWGFLTLAIAWHDQQTGTWESDNQATVHYRLTSAGAPPIYGDVYVSNVTHTSTVAAAARPALTKSAGTRRVMSRVIADVPSAALPVGRGPRDPIDHPFVILDSLTCPGGTGIEPGVEFTISGHVSYGDTVSDVSVTVICENRSYIPALAEDGSFAFGARCYHNGPIRVTASAYGRRANGSEIRAAPESTSMNVTLTSAQPSAALAALPAEIDLIDKSGTSVPVTVTTGDTDQCGPREVRVGAGLASIGQDLSQLNSTTFTGAIQLPPMPLGPTTVTAVVSCPEAPDVPPWTSQVQIVGLDNTPPAITVTFPVDNEVLLLDALNADTTITLTGTVTDDQSGVATLEWSWNDDGSNPTSVALPGAGGSASAWSLTLTPAESPGGLSNPLTAPLFIWATDEAGNKTPLQRFTLVLATSYTPKSLDERLAGWWYLRDLLSFACANNGQVATSAADPPTRPSYADIQGVLLQPVTQLAFPATGPGTSVGDAKINELRVPIEVLRQHIAEMPDPPSQERPDYLQAAYAALVGGLGTSYTRLRMARLADQDDRAALATRLGIVLSGPTPSQPRPDQLDQLTLDGPKLTEAALEQLFGLASTQTSVALQRPAPPYLLRWQQTAARLGWHSQDLTPPIPVAYSALVDPDIVAADEVLAADVAATHRQRQDDLAARLTAITAASGTPPARFAAMLATADAGLPAGYDLAAVYNQQQSGTDISAQLAAGGLDQRGFLYLCQLQQLIAITDVTVTDAEWADAADVLVAAYRRRQSSTWRQEEIEGNYVLDPDSFCIVGAGPDVGSYRQDTAARQDWQWVLSTRTAEYQALLDAAAGMVALAEQAALPVLRDSLLADVAGHGGSIQTAGEALTREYLIEMLASGTLTTTRIAVATASVQLLLADLRTGEVSNTGASGWTVPNTDAFDQYWPAMSSYGAWASAMNVYFFPEALVNPALWTSPSPAFTTLLTALQNGGVASSTVLDKAVDDYQIASNATNLLNASVVPLSYRPFSETNQNKLATLCATVAQADLNADQAGQLREMFWVVPLLIGGLLADQGRYADALDWYGLTYHYTNPLKVPSIYSQVNNDLTLSLTLPPTLPPPQLGKDIWIVEPLDPFTLTADAAARPVPHLRASLLAIVSCLRHYADAQFTVGTDQAIAQARQMYLDARDLTGHPCFTLVQPVPEAEPPLPIPQLSGLATAVTSRLAKLRQGRNIAGQIRVPATDDFTVIAQASRYTYVTLLSRAQQLTTQAEQIEAQFLNALVSLDAKNLQLENAQQALDLAGAQVTTHQDQVTIAQGGAQSAQAQLAKANSVETSLQNAISSPSNSYEQSLLNDYQTTSGLQDLLAGVDAAISIGTVLSTQNAFTALSSAGADPLAASVAIAGVAVKAEMQTTLNDAQAQTQADQLQASIEDRVQQWQLQLVSAQGDINVAASQVQSANDQVATAKDELAVAQLQNTQAAQTLQTLQNQVTGAAMYSWLVQTLGGVYRFFLQQATSTAQLAQAQLAFERAEPPHTFIRSDYWQPPAILVTSATPSKTYGLTGAEQLSQDLTTLDQYAFSSDQRRLNISQTFSLSQLLPQEFIDFRRTGELSFQTPMSWFDQDFPGHYLRLIRQVSLSVVALVPTSRGIRATLDNNGMSLVTTQSLTGFSDVTLRREPGTISVTATSVATGVFTADPSPSMLLPFQGSGVDTTWSLSLPPAANPFDYSSIADVLLSIDYTALSDSGYHDQVIRGLNANRDRSADCLFSLASSYPDQWYQLNNPDDPTQPRSVTINLRNLDFPINIRGLSTSAITLQLVPANGTELTPVAVTLSHNNQSGQATTDSTGLVGTRRGAADWIPLFGAPTGDWQLTLDPAGGALLDSGAITDVLLDITWTGQSPAWQ
jgi:GH15 family glucan-1,4-alpha-glucosidase